jgi:CRP-like cAMP-binding protein
MPTLSPLDHAIAALVRGDVEPALRASIGVLATDAYSAGALLVTAKLLGQVGSQAVALGGLRAAVAVAIATSRLALALVAVQEIRQLEVDAGVELDAIARAYCIHSKRLVALRTAPPPPLASAAIMPPRAVELHGSALVAAAEAQLVRATQLATAKYEASDAALSPSVLFSQLNEQNLRTLLDAFTVRYVDSGVAVIEQGADGDEAYVVARGELEVVRAEPGTESSPARNLVLAALGGGALFGEMALLARAPRVASVRTRRPAVLLVTKREALERAALRDANIGNELAAHCKRRMVANLLRTSPALLAVPAEQRPALIERFRTVTFDAGSKLIAQGEEARGLHLIASGCVSVVARDGAESTILATLGPGQLVGEVALVLRRAAGADVVALHPTVTLHLPDEDFLGLIEAHPAILHSLYLLAVSREQANATSVADATMDVTDDSVLV